MSEPRVRWLCALGVATTMCVLPVVRVSASPPCDLGAIRTQAQGTFPEYDVQSVRSTGGIVTLSLARPGGAGVFGVALRTAGGVFFTSVMTAQVDTEQSTERARVDQLVASWDAVAPLQDALERCSRDVSLDAGVAEEAVRRAASGALGDVRLGDLGESRIVVGMLLLSLAIILVPGFRRGRVAFPRSPADRRDLGLLLFIALVAVAIAIGVAWNLAPETDEVVTLATRHQPFSSLLSWNLGGEPFNPPGTAAIFALWLRLVGGLFSARILSIALVPLTAWVAYRTGSAMSGRYLGLSFAGLVVMAPAYLRLAAIARGYTLIVLSLCAMLAAIARTDRVRSRGRAVGMAGVFGLWVSYLLWPLALAAPWIARLDRRDRLRVTGALALMAAALAPRIANGFATAVNKADVYELRGPADLLGYALAAVGQAPPGNAAGSEAILWLARGIAAVLIVMAIVRQQRSAPRQFRNTALALALVTVPVLALLSGGHGIRERHVIGVQVALALLAATGLGAMISAPRGSSVWTLGWLLAIALAGVSVLGNIALVRSAGGWIGQLGRLSAGADLVVVVPRNAQMAVHAMLTGDSPLGSKGMRWPPVCQSDTEWWCRRVGELETISVDEVTDDVVASAAASSRSIWIFDQRGADLDHEIPPRIRACEEVLRNSSWLVLECSSMALRQQ